MFLDESRIFVAGGKGGDGLNAMRREKYRPFGGPAGGTGGRGGDVILVATRNHKTLQNFRGKVHFKGPPGGRGGRSDRTGKDGDDLLVEVPLGTVVRDDETGGVLADLATEGTRWTAAQGGRGGRGNRALASDADPLPRWAEKGEPGQERWVKLELRLMADVGLLGLPNAGKSTLLTVLTNARAKVAAYPFTTLEPQLGTLAFGVGKGERGFVLADIPGLVAGASEGTGLGDRFLRHLRRNRVLLHLVDPSGTDGNDPVQAYRTIRAELSSAHPDLAEKPEVVVATKMDLAESEAGRQALEEALGRPVLGISAATQQGLDELVEGVLAVLAETPEPGPLTFAPTPVFRLEEDPEQAWEVVQEEDDFWSLQGPEIERILAMHDLDNEEAADHVDRQLRARGVYRELAKRGAKDGDTVRLGDHLFDYIPEE